MLISVHAASSTANDNRLKEALLEFGEGQDLLVAILHPFWHQHQLIIVIIQALDDGDAEPLKALDGLEDAQDISIHFLAVRGKDAGNTAVVQQVQEAVLGMARAEGAVDGDRYGRTEEIERITHIVYSSCIISL